MYLKNCQTAANNAINEANGTIQLLNSSLSIYLKKNSLRFKFIAGVISIGEYKIFCVNEKIHTKKEVPSVE